MTDSKRMTGIEIKDIEEWTVASCLRQLKETVCDIPEETLIFRGHANKDWTLGPELLRVPGRPIEKLDKTFAAVATNLNSGEMMVFRTGDTGAAVRASSSVPVFFQPESINGQDYVDGGLVTPVPVSVARSLGADFVIAVDISDRPMDRKTDGIVDILWQTFSIFGQTINRYELPKADVVVRPVTYGIPATDVSGRNKAVLEGEKAVAAILPDLKAKLAKLNETRQVTGMP